MAIVKKHCRETYICTIEKSELKKLHKFFVAKNYRCVDDNFSMPLVDYAEKDICSIKIIALVDPFNHSEDIRIELSNKDIIRTIYVCSYNEDFDVFYKNVNQALSYETFLDEVENACLKLSRADFIFRVGD